MDKGDPPPGKKPKGLPKKPNVKPKGFDMEIIPDSDCIIDIKNKVEIKTTNAQSSVLTINPSTPIIVNDCVMNNVITNSAPNINTEIKNTEVNELILYKFQDQGPYTIYIEYINIGADSKPLNDIRTGRLLNKLRLKSALNTKQIGKFRNKIVFKDKDEANKLISDKSLEPENLKAFIPKQYVERVGVIKDVPEELSENEILENIVSKYKVKAIWRFKRKLDTGNMVNTSTIKIVFEGQLIPDEVVLFFACRKVLPYIFSVTQCRLCFLFGHIEKNCKGQKRCQICSEVNLEDHVCSNVVKCRHCNEQHTSNSKLCLEFRRQKHIKELMSLKNMSFQEANGMLPKVQNRFTVLENLEEFPMLEIPRFLKGRNLEEERRMVNINRKISLHNQKVNKSKIVDKTFTQAMEESEDDIVMDWSQPIVSNPHRVSNFEAIVNELSCLVESSKNVSPSVPGTVESYIANSNEIIKKLILAIKINSEQSLKSNVLKTIDLTT